MKKPILFIDFDGTICHDRYWHSLSSNQNQQLQELLFQNNKEMVNDWMRGKYTAEEVNQFVAHNLKISYKTLWKNFVKDCETVRVSQEVLNKIKSLSGKYNTILITGNMDSFTRFTVPALNLNKYFDLISNSYYEEKHKTDEGGKLFIKYIDRFNANVRECIIIDDSKKVCSVFNNLGGTTCLIDLEKDIEFYLSNLD